jgi:SAM-dependent methyltransferase
VKPARILNRILSLIRSGNGEFWLEQHQFGSRVAELTLPRHAYFEARAWIGRMISPKRRRPKQALLQIGSGLNRLPQFENIDFYFAYRGEDRHVGHDIRRPLPYDDNSFDGAFSEHTLEHMYPADAMTLLAEVARVLKPGAVFRCSVPDLGKYVRFYEGGTSSGEFAMFGSGCEAFWNLTQNHLHRSVWDATMLKTQMLAHGFSHAEEASFGQGQDPRLIVDLEHRAWESLYVEGRK